MIAKSTRFILIDDDPVSNMICKLTIERVLGKSDIRIFTNAEVALEYINKEYTVSQPRQTAILLDINMPIMSGWEFLEVFETLSEEIQNYFEIYILSSSLDPRDRDRSIVNKHVKDHLVKPLTADVINAIAALS